MDKYINKIQNIKGLELLCDPKKVRYKNINNYKLENNLNSNKNVNIEINEFVINFKKLIKNILDNFNPNKISNNKYDILLQSLWYHFISEYFNFNPENPYLKNFYIKTENFHENLIKNNNNNLLKIDILDNIMIN